MNENYFANFISFIRRQLAERHDTPRVVHIQLNMNSSCLACHQLTDDRLE